MPQPLIPQTFEAALETMNRSIEEHRDALFFQTLLQAWEAMDEEQLLGVAIYRTDPEQPDLFYTIRMNEGKLQLVEQGQHFDQPDWRVSEDYLHDLAINRNKYIDHPEKLSLNWLAERVVSTTT